MAENIITGLNKIIPTPIVALRQFKTKIDSLALKRNWRINREETLNKIRRIRERNNIRGKEL